MNDPNNQLSDSNETSDTEVQLNEDSLMESINTVGHCPNGGSGGSRLALRLPPYFWFYHNGTEYVHSLTDMTSSWPKI